MPLTAFLLIAVGALSRLVPFEYRPVNFTVMGAIALYAGARLPRRWAWAVPIAAHMLSDLVLDFGTKRALLDPVRLTIYATYLLIALLGTLARGRRGSMARAGLALAASALFFATSNFAVWAAGTYYPHTRDGLAACYAAAVPFFRNMAAGDLLGTALLFGLEAPLGRLARSWFARRPEPALLPAAKAD